MFNPGMPQLVGQNCTLCEKGIGSILEGHFCSECGCPVHNRCADNAQRQISGVCEVCGSASIRAEALREMERHETETLVQDIRSQIAVKRIMTGVVWIVGGVALTLFCLGVSSGGTYIVATGPIVFGVAQVIYGVALLGRQSEEKGPQGPSSENDPT